MTQREYEIEVATQIEASAYWTMEQIRSGVPYAHTRKQLADAIRNWRKASRAARKLIAA